MQAANKSWREQWKCSSLRSQGPQVRQTYIAKGRLIAGEIEYKSQFSPWINNWRLVFKMKCRCLQIWQVNNWTETRQIFVLFSSPPSSVKDRTKDLNFRRIPQSFCICFVKVGYPRLSHNEWVWFFSVCTPFSTNTQNSFIKDLARIFSFSSSPSAGAKKASELRLSVDVKTSPRVILEGSKTKRLIASPGWKTG